MAGVRITRCNPTLLDFVTWAVLKGCRLFQRVHITPQGLIATERISEFDFVAVVPVEATQSVLSIADDPSFALKVSPEEHGEPVPFWEDLSRGSFAFVGFLTKVLLTGHLRGVRSYLDVLPFDQELPIGKVADEAQTTKGYREWTAPLVAQCKVEECDFDLAFRHAYCLFRRHAIPFWSSSDVGSAGHPYFQQSLFAQRGRGELMGMVPVMDLALHSPKPNATIGYPDEEMLQWLLQRKNAAVPQTKSYFVMQALRDIEEGEVISVNKNAYFNFDADTFKAWFGYPNVSQVAEKGAESSAVGMSRIEEMTRF
ncbi:hypothetical protein JKF63_01383 [Porcisia hertigi]|uniref:SET domain-containing protein n=1 Tax=Porcisia hertigi TaxID=2761500 RepID=A0A836L9X0_9TRYP|nr:hypothetical protein JKF63_01383 [Porcisia hertigi]